MDNDDMQRALEFIHREARVLERRIADTVFAGAPRDPVADALRAYRNPDGGFGWGLEPDKRVPASQPLDVEVAWQSLDWIGVAPTELVTAACDYLAGAGSGVGCVTPAVREHPHAPHWADAFHDAGLNPTASLAGYLWRWSIEHPWRGAATAFCWYLLDEALPSDALTAVCVLRFLAHVPDRERAEAMVEALRPKLASIEWLQHEPDAAAYGVTPLQLVPEPGSPWRTLFPAGVIDAHLDALEKAQADDGGWMVTWPTIGPAAESEWRGRRTLEHLMVLRAYGRLG